jgi:hypothetical protein
MPAFEEGAALKEQGECAENFEVHDPKNVGTFGVCGTLLYCAQILCLTFMSSLAIFSDILVCLLFRPSFSSRAPGLSSAYIF